MFKSLYDYFVGAEEFNYNFWKHYLGTAHLYKKTNSNEDYELYIQNAKIKFREQSSYCYEIIFNSSNDSYVFPIHHKMNPTFEIRENSVVIELRIEKKLYLQLEFPIINDNFEDSGQFKEIICRLIF